MLSAVSTIGKSFSSLPKGSSISSPIISIPTKTKNINITTSTAQPIKVKFYSMLGQEVISKDYQLVSGSNDLNFASEDLASATYNAIFYVGNATYSKKLVVSRN